jgi:hypothetical protein
VCTHKGAPPEPVQRHTTSHYTSTNTFADKVMCCVCVCVWQVILLISPGRALTQEREKLNSGIVDKWPMGRLWFLSLSLSPLFMISFSIRRPALNVLTTKENSQRENRHTVWKSALSCRFDKIWSGPVVILLMRRFFFLFQSLIDAHLARLGYITLKRRKAQRSHQIYIKCLCGGERIRE